MTCRDVNAILGCPRLWVPDFGSPTLGPRLWVPDSGSPTLALKIAASGDEGEKHPDAIKKLFAKHGITEKMLEDGSESTGSFEERMMEFIKPIKNRMAFIAEMGNTISDELQESMPIKGATALSDVKEDGDPAQGTMTFKIQDQDETDKLDFKRVDGSWLIEMKDCP